MTRFKRFIVWLQNHRWLSLILFAGLVVIVIGKFTDAVSDIRSFLFPQRDTLTSTVPVELTVDVEVFLPIIVKHLDEKIVSLTGPPGTPESVLSYIDSIAHEAKSLANVWADIVSDLENGSRLSYSDFTDLMVKYDVSRFPNEPYFSRLSKFYEFLPEAVGEKVEVRWIARLSSSVEMMILQRGDAQETLERLSSELSNPGFFEGKNTRDDLQNLRTSVVVLQREAAAIEALSKAIRAHSNSQTPSKGNPRPAGTP